ncbi:hypothetical protein FHW04_003387 [Pantoea sp. AN62]
MMKESGLIPVTISAVHINGVGNLSLQLIARHGGLLPAYLPGAHIDVFIPQIGRVSIHFAAKTTAVNITRSA